MDLTPAAAGGAEDAFTLSMTAEAVALAQIITAPVTMQVPGAGNPAAGSRSDSGGNNVRWLRPPPRDGLPASMWLP